MAVLEGPSVYAPSSFFHGWGTPVLLVMAIYVLKNWSGTFILKRLDSLKKNIAEAFAMLMLYLLEISPFFGNKGLEMPTLCVTVMVALLVCSYLESKKVLLKQTTGKTVSLRVAVTTKWPSPLQRRGRRLGKKYGLLPTHSVTTMSQTACRVIANKNVGHDALGSPLVPQEETFGLIDKVQMLLQAAIEAGPGTDWQTCVCQAIDMCKDQKCGRAVTAAALQPHRQVSTGTLGSSVGSTNDHRDSPSQTLTNDSDGELGPFARLSSEGSTSSELGPFARQCSC